MTLNEVVAKAIEIIEAHEEGAVMDAGFDAGEFSGPAHAMMMEREITKLAVDNSFTYDQVWCEVIRSANCETPNAVSLPPACDNCEVRPASPTITSENGRQAFCSTICRAIYDEKYTVPFAQLRKRASK